MMTKINLISTIEKGLQIRIVGATPLQKFENELEIKTYK